MGFSFFNKKDKQQPDGIEQNINIDINSAESAESEILALVSIQIGLESVTKDKAIEMAGQLLVDGGYVLPEYIEAMKEREKVLTTYIGEGIAIPHGVGSAKDKILKSGISILQFPAGILFGEGKVAYVVVGIAGKGNEHMTILSKLAELIQEGEILKDLFTTKDKMNIYDAFMYKNNL